MPVSAKPNSPKSAPHIGFGGLYAVTPDEPDTRLLCQKVAAAVAGGLGWIQYRNKRADSAQQHRQAEALCALAHAAGAKLIVNDDYKLALAIGADGVHLGRDDLTSASMADIRLAARALPHPFLIGRSCYDQLALADIAAAEGADYIAFGSFFPSATKPHAARADVALLREARQRYSLPIVAIGGITLENAPQLVEAGADAVAVITDLFLADDISLRAQHFNQLFAHHV